MSINNWSGVGRLTRDIDLRFTPQGVAVGNGTMAINRPFKNQAGENEADFINIVIWRKQAENAANYTKKGSLIGVTGRLQSRTYKDKDDKTVFVTEVVAESVQFLEPKNSTQNKQSTQESSSNQSTNKYVNNQTNQKPQDPFANDGEPIDITDDMLPF